jgi:hypothetical protein
MPPFEIIEFSIFGLKLQEPMAVVSNWLISFFCVFAVFSTKWNESVPSFFFKRFYIFLGISTFLSGFGHSFFYYFGIFGKYPAWVLASTSGYFISRGILFYWKEKKSYIFLSKFLIIKTISLIMMSLLSQNFLFILIDSIFTYIIYCGILAAKIWKMGINEMKYFVLGIFILLPSIFIFLLKLNLNLYLNRDDLSHFIILFTIFFFLIAIRKNNQRYSRQEFVL